MSKTVISIERINSVEHHPDADRLDIVQVLGYNVITGRDNFDVGDSAVYFPPDILLPEMVVNQLGVGKYLKHAVFPGDLGSSQCRVGACRLRGIPSHGFLVPTEELFPLANGLYEFGENVTEVFAAHKYEPPLRCNAGDASRDGVNFPQYTSIENVQRYPGLIEEGTEVVITEKIHGTNVRMGIVEDEGEYNYAAGSHKVRRKEGHSLYWQFLSQEIKNLLLELKNNPYGLGHNVLVFGEIFGNGIQDMDYGAGVPCLRVFDIMVDKQYLDYDIMLTLCERHQIATVPLLYRGPFDREIMEKLTYGPTTFKNVKCKFKDREGCVARPVVEQEHPRFGRCILKSVSADYRNRKGAKDLA